MSKQKKPSTIGTAIKKMLGIKTAELNFMEEEALQSPGRVAARNFFSKPTATFGLIVFLLIFVFVLPGEITTAYKPSSAQHFVAITTAAFVAQYSLHVA